MVTDTVRGAGVTATGGRKANEDALLAEAPVYVVADGMGGHLAGADSSRAVVDAFHPLVGAVDVAVGDVVAAVERARQAVAAVMTAHGGQSGSTLTGAVLVSVDGAPWWLVLNVGDSRVYAFHGGRLAQITVDHSRVQELVDAGQLAPEEAERHPERNVITRAIGDGLPGQDLWLVPVERDRRLVVVSDGLTKALPDARIAELLAQDAPPADAARLLVETAVAAGARDNVTVVVAEAGTARTPAAAPTGGLPVWSAPGDAATSAGRSGAGAAEDDDATRVASRRSALDDDATQISARRSALDDDATQISARRSAQDDDATQVSSRRSAFDHDATRVASRRTPQAGTTVPPVRVAPAPGSKPAPASDHGSPAAQAKARFDGRRGHGRSVREAPPIVVPSMPAPASPEAAHRVIDPSERARREGRARMRTRAALVAGAATVAMATLAAAGTGIWLLATL